MYFNQSNINKVKKAIEILGKRDCKISIAESCTGGILSGLFTEIPGSSKVFDRGFVTYSNLAKIEMLGVNKKILNEFGAVSSRAANEMVLGAIKNSLANIAISITGIAGPDSDDSNKPVGLVYFGLAIDDMVITQKQNFSGDRSKIRNLTVDYALDLLLSHFKN